MLERHLCGLTCIDISLLYFSPRRSFSSFKVNKNKSHNRFFMSFDKLEFKPRQTSLVSFSFVSESKSEQKNSVTNFKIEVRNISFTKLFFIF